MRLSIAAVVGVIVLAAAAQAGLSAGQTQGEMNESAGRDMQAAEADMADAVARLVNLAAGRPATMAKLERAQEAWEGFRDAHIAAFWPSEEASAYGSMHAMCVANERARLTRARTAELLSMLNGVEGDGCACRWPD